MKDGDSWLLSTARSGSVRSSYPTFISAHAAAKPAGFSISCAITMPTPSIWSAISSDGWQLRSGWYWPQHHNDVVQKLLRKARKGARIFYLPGNHDEFLRDYYGTHVGGIEVVEQLIHEAADGRRYLVVHGDVFDMVVKHARWLALLGDTAYDFAIFINRYFNAVRRRLGFTYWSLSQWAKHKVKNAVNYIGAYEQTLAEEAHRHHVDGVICGHIHHAVIHDTFGIRYMNCGDWVESCTALAEHPDGRFEIITWTEGVVAPHPPLPDDDIDEIAAEAEIAA